MKRAITAIAIAALLAGCVSTGKAVVPALAGAQRVPVNKTIPEAAPFTAPATATSTTTTGD